MTDEHKLMRGKPVADAIYAEIREKMEGSNKRPYLVVVQVGEDPASTVYIKYKRMACEKLGFGFRLDKFPSNITTKELLHEVESLNNDVEVTGMIVQLPLPDQIDKMIILNAVKPKKDVDCFAYENIGRMYYGVEYETKGHVPATAWGIHKMIQHYGVETRGKTCVILGKSTIVGRPLSLLLGDENGPGCTIVMCDKHTADRKSITKLADILIVATGVHHLISDPDELKPGCVVIDVGIHQVGVKDDGKRIIQGDVDFEAVKEVCSLITPVPGGVGPTTVATLMANLVESVL